MRPRGQVPAELSDAPKQIGSASLGRTMIYIYKRSALLGAGWGRSFEGLWTPQGREMNLSLTTEVKYLKGVGPQRAALLGERGIHTVEDLLYYLPFRYEDRIHFSPIRSIQPGATYTVLAEVMSGGVVRFARSRNAIYHLTVRDPTG